MNQLECSDYIREANTSLLEVKSLLLAHGTDTMVQIQPHLERTACKLEGLSKIISETSRTPQILSELVGLQHQVSVVQALIEQAGGFHLGWAQVLATMLGGYTPHGEPVDTTPRRRISVQG